MLTVALDADVLVVRAVVVRGVGALVEAPLPAVAHDVVQQDVALALTVVRVVVGVAEVIAQVPANHAAMDKQRISA